LTANSLVKNILDESMYPIVLARGWFMKSGETDFSNDAWNLNSATFLHF
jgi:hypothetical protein